MHIYIITHMHMYTNIDIHITTHNIHNKHLHTHIHTHINKHTRTNNIQIFTLTYTNTYLKQKTYTNRLKDA